MTSSQMAMGYLQKANSAAQRGDFLGARQYWSDACWSLVSAKRAGEHRSGEECDEVFGYAIDFLTQHGQDMASAYAKDPSMREAAEKELARLHGLIEQIRKFGGQG
jgi:hypothetical protein